MDDSSEKSAFCYFSAVHPFSKRGTWATATQFLSCHLINAGFFEHSRSPGSTGVCQTVMQLRNSWPWTVEGTNGPYKVLPCLTRLTWASREQHQFLQNIFSSSPLWIHWISLSVPPQLLRTSTSVHG